MSALVHSALFIDTPWGGSEDAGTHTPHAHTHTRSPTQGRAHTNPKGRVDEEDPDDVGLVEGDAGGEGQAGDQLEHGQDRVEPVSLVPVAGASTARSQRQ